MNLVHYSTTVCPFGGEERKDETRIFDELSARARGEGNFARPTIDAQPDNDRSIFPMTTTSPQSLQWPSTV